MSGKQMNQTRAVICGYYGQGNAGDEALLMSLLQMLPEHIKPIVLSGNPAQTSDRLGVESCPRRATFPILKALGQSDFFIWGGGSLMQDVTSMGSPLYYGGLMALAQQQGLKTIAWAQGIGPLKHPLTRSVTKRVLLGCIAVSVRDKASAKLLSDWQIPCILATDPVWALKEKPVTGLWKTKAPTVAVNLRSHPQLTEKRIENLIQALVDFQRATECYILLVPFQPSQDLAIARRVASQLPLEHKIISLEDPRELKGLFRHVDMAIAMRYHSLIMAAAASSRCCALSYDPKVSQLMAQLNLPGWELEELPDDPKIISKTWLEQYTNDEPQSIAQTESLVESALLHQELLNQVVTSHS